MNSSPLRKRYYFDKTTKKSSFSRLLFYNLLVVDFSEKRIASILQRIKFASNFTHKVFFWNHKYRRYTTSKFGKNSENRRNIKFFEILLTITFYQYILEKLSFYKTCWEYNLQKMLYLQLLLGSQKTQQHRSNVRVK